MNDTSVHQSNCLSDHTIEHLSCQVNFPESDAIERSEYVGQHARMADCIGQYLDTRAYLHRLVVGYLPNVERERIVLMHFDTFRARF